MWRLSDEDLLVTPLPVYASDALERASPIPVFDSHVAFMEEAHEYRVDGVLIPRSVTGLIHAFTTEFDPRAVLRSMDTENRMQRYGSLSDEDVMAMWERNGAVARARGTLMHRQIEWLLNGGVLDDPSPEVEQFIGLFPSFGAEGLQIFRTELSVYSAELNVAGQIDALFVDLERVLSLSLIGKEARGSSLIRTARCCILLIIFRMQMVLTTASN